MKRRDIFALLGGTAIDLAFPARGQVHAQTAQGARYLGVMGVGSPPPREMQEKVWAPARDLGWIEGQNVKVDRLFGTREQLDEFARELVRRRVELIIAVGTAAALAAKRATTSVPIVMIANDDPVQNGLVASLAKPGGNITGVTEMEDDVAVKRLELIRELLPNAKRIAVVVYESETAKAAPRVITEAIYQSFGMQPFKLEVSNRADIIRAISDAAQRGADVLLATAPGLPLYEVQDAFMRAAIERKLATIVDETKFVAAGALASLGIDFAEQYQASWYFVDKILRGAQPSDLPVQQPKRFIISINARTARALGVTIPQALRLRADEIFD